MFSFRSSLRLSLFLFLFASSFRFLFRFLYLRPTLTCGPIFVVSFSFRPPLPSFTELRQTLLSSTEFYWFFTKFYRVLPGFYRGTTASAMFMFDCFIMFYWVLPGFTGFYQIFPGFTGFYRVKRLRVIVNQEGGRNRMRKGRATVELNKNRTCCEHQHEVTCGVTVFRSRKHRNDAVSVDSVFAARAGPSTKELPSGRS